MDSECCFSRQRVAPCLFLYPPFVNILPQGWTNHISINIQAIFVWFHHFIFEKMAWCKIPFYLSHCELHACVFALKQSHLKCLQIVLSQIEMRLPFWILVFLISWQRKRKEMKQILLKEFWDERWKVKTKTISIFNKKENDAHYLNRVTRPKSPWNWMVRKPLIVKDCSPLRPIRVLLFN